MKSEICENCGLPEKLHPLKKMININTRKRWSCKEFKAAKYYCCKCQDFFKEPHNHSPRGNRRGRKSFPQEPEGDSLESSNVIVTSGSDNQSPKTQEIQAKQEIPSENNRPKKTLSDKILIATKDVKEFIQDLKEHYEIKGWEIIKTERLIKIIDDLAGNDLIESEGGRARK